MAKIQDHDFSKESVQIQEFLEDVRKILNKGLMEIEFTASTSPDYSAPSETRFVMSIFGAQRRLYISANSQWYYVTLSVL